MGFQELNIQRNRQALQEDLVKHNHPVLFGRREKDCPRCAELDKGAPVRQQSWRNPKSLGGSRSNDIAAHFASEKHKSGGCGPVCTYGDY